MRVLTGLDLSSVALTERDDLPMAGARIGDVAWGPRELLSDLELRLGLQMDAAPEALRIAAWSARMASLAPRQRFYSKSFSVDPQGTAAAVLRLRDSLIEAGWRGAPIPDGGARLAALQELEQTRVPPLPPGDADRLQAVGDALVTAHTCPYAELSLVESVGAWPGQWQFIFQQLERLGARLGPRQLSLPGAPPDSDLGKIQVALGTEVAGAKVQLQGDGSLLLLTAETAWEAARAAASLLSAFEPGAVVVIREQDPGLLDNALEAQGVRTQGWHSSGRWRSALQVLPLALELAFEPKDPYRVLELLTLPLGPFQGSLGRALARALAQSPGIGSPSWEYAKTKAHQRGREPARAAEQLARVHDWIEVPGADPIVGARKQVLLAVAERVRDWVLSRISLAPDDAPLLAAAHHAKALSLAVAGDARETFSLVHVRNLVEGVIASGSRCELLRERAGRMDHVGCPGALGAPRPTVLWWPFIEPDDVLARLPWRGSEISALARVGVRFLDPRERLAQRVEGHRRALRCATERVILVAPRSRAGETVSLHPLWDEIVVRAQLNDSDVARLCVGARDLLNPRSSLPVSRPSVEARSDLALPGGRPEWAISANAIAGTDSFSPSSLSALLGCPLKWVLRHAAGIREAGSGLPALIQLSGTLGHRLVESLHLHGAFALDEASLRGVAERQLETLFHREGALLLRPGMAVERYQLQRQLVGSIVELQRFLSRAQLSILAVEEAFEIAWRGSKLEGRLDLLVMSNEGQSAIIDMKWGIADYRDSFRLGRALQLAAYGHAHSLRQGSSELPHTAYFSLKQGKLVSLSADLFKDSDVISGPDLRDTWQNAERTFDVAVNTVANGRVPATGLRSSLPLLRSFGVDAAHAATHYVEPSATTCKYCAFDAVCGKRWEALQ